MTIATEFDDQRATLWVRPQSLFSIADLAGYFRRLADDERLAEAFVEVVSLTGVKATIFVGTAGLQFGIANMLAGLLSIYRPDHAVTTTDNEDEIPALIARAREGEFE